MIFVDCGTIDVFVIAYPRCLVLECYQHINPTVIEDVINYRYVKKIFFWNLLNFFSSVYKNYICYEKARGRLNIVKIQHNGNTSTFIQVWFSRIYSSLHTNCLNIWNGICTVVINNEVQRSYYKSEGSQIEELTKIAKLKTSLSLTSDITYQILRDDIIVALGIHLEF